MKQRIKVLLLVTLTILVTQLSYAFDSREAAETAITFTSSASATVDENTVTATTVTATGAASLSYSITGGADQALFSINSSSGELSFTDVPDFENPSDSNIDQVYEVQITASDGLGGSASQALSITIADAVESTTRFVDLPVIIYGDENGTEVHTFQASAGDGGGTVSFSIIGGIHQAQFSMNSTTGELTYATPQDAESTSSLNVMIRATDGVTNHDINLGIFVGDVDEFPLSFPAAGPFSIFEGRTQVGYMYAADADQSNPSYSVTGGADASSFVATGTYDPNTFQPAGLLSFATAPDFASPSDANGDNVYEVEVTATSGNQSLSQTISVTVNQETPTYTLTVTVQNASKTYGDANPAFTVSYSGFQGSDDASILDTAPTVTTAIDETTGAGAHALTASGGVDGLYIFNYVSGTLTINQRELTISPNDVSMVYGDQTTGVLTTDVGFTVTGFVNGDDVNDLTFSSTTSTPFVLGSGNQNVGTYPNSVLYFSTVPTPDPHPNYIYGYGNGSLIVTPAPITVTAVANTKVYDQDTSSDPAFTYTAGGLPTGGNFITYPDPLTLLTGTPTRVAGEAVGTYAIQQGSVAVNNSNYEINSFVEADFTITKAQLTAQPSTSLIFKAYGDPVPSNIAVQYSGFVGSDNASGIDTPPTFTAAVNETTVVSSTRYAVTGSGGVDDSYTFNLQDGELLVVRRQITINIDDQTIHYGDAIPSGSGLTFTVPAGQLANGEDFNTAYPGGIDLEISPTILPHFYPAVGTYADRIVITHPTGFSDNYFVSTNPGVAPRADVIIEPRPVTIPTLTPVSTPFTGSAISFTPPTLSNPVLSGTLAQKVEYKLTSESASAYTTTAPTAIGTYDVQVSLADSETNFTAVPETTTLTVTKIPASVFLNSLTHTYDGSAKAAGATTSPSGLTVNLTYEGTGATTYALSTTPPSSPGTYTVVGTIDDFTYMGTESGTLTINKAPATVTISNLSQVFDSTPKAVSITTNPVSLTVDVTYNGGNTIPSAAGTYTVVATINDTNYQGSDTQTLTIATVNATISLNLPASDPIYTGNAQGISPFANDLNENPTLALVTEYSVQGANSYSTTTPTDAGIYDVRVNLDPSETDYTAAEVTGTFTIAKAPLTATLDNAAIVYGTFGANNHPVTFSGFVNGETESALTINPGHPTVSFYDAVGSSHYPVGGPHVGGITWTAGASSNITSSNYDITFLPGDLTVTPRPVVVTGDNRSIFYGDDANAGNSVTFEANDDVANRGLAFGESAADFTGTLSFASITQTNAGSYAGVIVPSGYINSNYSITYVNGDLTINKVTLTVTADDQNRIYGATNPSLTLSYTGFANSETASVLDTEPTATTSATTASNVGTYDIIPSGGSDGNYDFSFVNGTLTIDKATLTATADDQNRIYGAANPGLTINYTGFANSETASVLDTEPTATTSAAVASNVGTYAIVPSGGSDGNYDFSFVNGTLTISKATLTASADDQNRVYGTVNPSLSISYTGFANSETASVLDVAPTATTSAIATSNVGTYTIVPSGGSDGNYDFSFVNGTLTIGKATLTATADDQNRIYGAANPTLTISYTGFANSETVGVLDTEPTASTSATMASNAGTYDIIPSGGSDGNYDFSYVNGTLTIGKATLTATADDKNRIYGAANPALTISYTGFANSETASVLDTEPTASTSATTASNAGTYDIIPSGGSDGNYDFSYVNGILTIGKATLTASADDQNRVYGTVNPSLSISYTGFANSETASVLDVAPTATTSAIATSNVGTYAIVPSGGSDGNYDFSFVNGTLTIGKATLTATADDQNRIYGAANPTLTISYTGFANSETASVLDTEPTASTSATPASNVGTYAIVPSGGSDGNYDFSFVNGTLTIGKATLTATADDQNRIYGAANPALTISYTGFANSETASVLDVVPTATTSAIATSDVGTYAIVPSGGSDGNYDFSFVDGTLTVGKATLTATADDQNRIYGAANPALTISYTGFANSETASVLDTEPMASTSASATSNVGTYDIIPSGGSDGNYDFSFVNGTLTIGKATLTATADDQNRIYGAANPALTISYSGFANSESASVLDVVPTASTSAIATSNVGTYAIVPSGGSDGNYDFSFVDGTLMVGKATLTATANDQNRIYGVANPALTVSYTGFANSETASVLDTEPMASTSATPASNVGTYAIVPSGGSDGNYDFSFVNGTLTVGKATLTATADDQNRIYGAANPALTISYSGFANSESASVLDVVPTATTSAIATSNVGTYAIVPSGGSDGNYDFSFVNGTLTIGKATLTATADDQNRIYGAANPALTISYTGFANSETASVLDTEPIASTSATAGSNVGIYDIIPSGGADGNYEFNFVNGTLTISKATLTARLDNASFNYGTTTVENHPVTYSGFVNGDDPSVLTIGPDGIIADVNEGGTLYTNGHYPVDIMPYARAIKWFNTGNTITAVNYNINYANGDLIVTKAPLTITADSRTITYGADANAGNTVTYGVFVSGEDESYLNGSLSFGNISDTNAGLYPGAIVPTGLTSNNYDITYVNGDLTINQATLMATADDQSKVYGEANPSLTVTYSGFQNGDDESTLTTAPTASTTADETSAVGSYAITASGGVDDNYTFSYTNGILTVDQASLTVTADDQSKTYGAANPSLTLTYSGFQNGDDEMALTTAPSANTTADETSTVGSYAITASGGVDDNYTFSYTDGTLMVNQATLSITADDQSKTYGAANPTLTVTYSGFQNGDDETTLTTAPSASTTADETSAVGSYAITASGGVDDNYTFSYTDGTLTVDQATLSVTADDQSKTYGAANPTLTLTYSGFQNGDDETALTTVPSAITTADETNSVGSYAITASGGEADNYAFNYTDGTLTVNQATLSVTVDDQSKTYGAANPTLTVTYSGFQNGEDETSLTIAPTASTTADETSAVGSYAITAAGGEADNYVFSYTDGTLTVNQATLNVTADNQSITYGEAIPTLSLTYSGFIGNDDETVLDIAPTASTTATTTSDAGAYSITVDGGVDTNYAFAYTEGSLTINKADQTITFDVLADKTVGDAAFDLTATATSGLTITYTSSDETVATVSGSTVTILGAGTTTITASQAGDTNFNAAEEATQILTVNTAVQDQTITFEALENRTYGEIFDLNATASSGLEVTYTSSDEAIATISGSTVTILSVGTVTITASQSGDDSFTSAENVEQTLIIDPATLTVTADDQTKVYGEANPTLTLTYGGFQNGEDETVLTTVPTVTSVADANSEVASYVIEVAGGSAANYTISTVNGTLTVTKAPLTITADDQTMTVGGVVPGLTTTIAGFVNGDTEADLDVLPAIATEVTSSSASGIYEITLTGGEDNNYEYTLINGTLTVETPLGLVLEQSQIMIYPNPVVEKLFIDFPQSLSGEEIKVQLFDLEGRLLQSKEVEGYGIELDVRAVPTGIMILQMSANGEVIRKRVKKD